MNDPQADSSRPPERLFALDRRDAFLCTLAVVLFVVSRFVWAHWNISAATYWEEEYRWAVANEILLGPIHPWLEYQADHYQGGSLVMVLLATGLFQMFGPSASVLKLAAILFSAGTLVLLYLVGKRGFGRPTALWATIAYLIGPPVVAFWGLTVMGSHGESVAFSLLQILIFFGLQSGSWRSRSGWFSFGLVSGLGLWFCYTSGLSLAACGIAWLLSAKPPRRDEIGWATLGGVTGLLPWFAYNADRGFVGLGRILEMIGVRPGPDPWIEQTLGEKVHALVFQDWPSGLLYPFPELRPDGLVELSLIAFSVPFAIALAASVWRVLRHAVGRGAMPAGERREIVFLIYGVIFLTFFLLSSFTIDPNKGPHEYRLFLPAAVLMLIPAARSVALGVARRGALRAATIAGVACFLIISAAGTYAVASRPLPPGAFKSDLGSMVRGLLLHRKYETNLDRAVGIAEKIEDPAKRWAAFRGIGWGVAFRFEEGGDVEIVKRELRRVKPPNRAAFRSGIQWAAEKNKIEIERRMREGIGRPDSELLLARFNTLLRLTSTPKRPSTGKPG